MEFSIKNIRSQKKCIKKEKAEIEETKKLNKKITVLSNIFRGFDKEKKIALFKDVAIISLNYSRKLVSATASSAYLKANLLGTKNLVMKKLLNERITLAEQKLEAYKTCIDTSNEFLRRDGWDIDMS